MARNLQLRILRGIFAHMPVLGAGELYLCTDTMELYVGSSGNKRVGVSAMFAAGLSGNANIQGPTSATIGPANPRKIVGYAQANFGGTVAWFPFMQ